MISGESGSTSLQCTSPVTCVQPLVKLDSRFHLYRSGKGYHEFASVYSEASIVVVDDIV